MAADIPEKARQFRALSHFINALFVRPRRQPAARGMARKVRGHFGHSSAIAISFSGG